MGSTAPRLASAPPPEVYGNANNGNNNGAGSFSVNGNNWNGNNNNNNGAGSFSVNGNGNSGPVPVNWLNAEVFAIPRRVATGWFSASESWREKGEKGEGRGDIAGET